MSSNNSAMKLVDRHRYNGNKIFQTRVLKFEPFRFNENNMVLVMGLIYKNLTPDLLSTKYREENKNNPAYGHCYHSTQALYYLMDTDKLIPFCGKDYRNDHHWWLQDGKKIYDITAAQYFSVGKIPPYDKGKPSKWYGYRQRPHQRSLNLMVRVLGERLIEDTLITVH